LNWLEKHQRADRLHQRAKGPIVNVPLASDVLTKKRASEKWHGVLQPLQENLDQLRDAAVKQVPIGIG
jgi:hypothetical protein